MTRPRSFDQFIRITAWSLLICALLYTAVTWLWRTPFAHGRVAGIYWLFIAIDRSTLPLTALAVLGFVATLLTWLVCAIRQSRPLRHLGVTTGIFLLAIVLFGTVALPVSLWTWQPLGSISARGHTYYLMTSQAFDQNFELFECDGWGVLCWRIYISIDIDRPVEATLEYNAQTDQVLLQITSDGELIDRWPEDRN